MVKIKRFILALVWIIAILELILFLAQNATFIPVATTFFMATCVTILFKTSDSV